MVSVVAAVTTEASADARTATGGPALRAMASEDAAQVWRIARDTGMDLNSPYAYLVWGEHFSATSLVAEADGAVVAYLTGYRLPDDPSTVFVWQVAVDPASRQGGLASRMLDALVERLHGVTALEATVTTSNEASSRLFRAFADRHGASVHTEVLFGSDLFPDGGHEPEHRFRIEPLTPGAGAPPHSTDHQPTWT